MTVCRITVSGRGNLEKMFVSLKKSFLELFNLRPARVAHVVVVSAVSVTGAGTRASVQTFFATYNVVPRTRIVVSSDIGL